MSIRALHILLGVVAFFVYRAEIRKESRYVFLNFSIFFLCSGISFSVCGLLGYLIEWGDQWIPFFLNEYAHILYQSLLIFTVVYLVIDFALHRGTVLQKYLFASAIALLTSWYCFSPYFVDPKYPYSTADIQDYRAIRSAIEQLENTGMPRPTSHEIAGAVHLSAARRLALANQPPQLGLEARVSEILPYLEGDGYVVLIYRTLWWHCLAIALVCIVLIVFSIANQYFTDPPRSAYFEKVVWCLLLYCCFEALHNFAFTKVTSWEMYIQVQSLGWYATMAIMLLFLLLFVVRLGFLSSIEGRYYENRLMTDPSRVTRWRDAFDNWVLHQFMNSAELEQRFLIQRKDKPSKDNDPELL